MLDSKTDRKIYRLDIYRDRSSRSK